MNWKEVQALILELREPDVLAWPPSVIHAELIRREIVSEKTGKPYSLAYVRHLIHATPEKVAANVAIRRSREKAARAQGRHSRIEWLDMIEVFGGLCVRCERIARPVTQDHIVPLRHGGSDAIENIQPLCRPCNSAGEPVDYRKKAKTVWTPEKIKELRSLLGESVEKFAARFGRSGRTVEDWEQGRRRPDVMVLLAMQRLLARRKEIDK